MARLNLAERIKEGLFLLDGAMGTQLIAHGVQGTRCTAYTNIESPDVVFDIHQQYLEAGSDAIITNTFVANKLALAHHGLDQMAEEINTTAARIARKATGREKYVLGDIGPSGDFLEPVGTLKAAQLRAAFAEQAKALLSGGVDGFIIETMTASDEARIAVEAVKSVCPLPVFVSFAYDKAAEGFRTMMGVDIEAAVAGIAPLGVDAVGFNCGTVSMDAYVKLANEYVSVVSRDRNGIAILAEPNAGQPRLAGDLPVYDLSPEDFAVAIEQIYSGGVRIIGGCCGTTPAHIKAVAEKLV